MKKHLTVVAAIIQHDNKFFSAQRANKGELALKWEFPGGKIEMNETPEVALIREIKEELGANIVVSEHFLTVDYEYETFKITLYSYMCKIKNKEDLILKEHVNSKWLTIKEIDSVDWALADIPIVKKLKETFNG